MGRRLLAAVLLIAALLLVAALLPLAVLPGATPPRAAAGEPDAADRGLRSEDREFFLWWDALGYPDVGRLPFVEVTTGGWTQASGEDPAPEVEHGFLVSEAAGTARVFLTDLTTPAFTAKAVPNEPWKSVSTSPADLEAFVTQGLAARRALGVDRHLWGRGPDPFRAHRWAHPDQSWMMLVLARACAARGREDLARSLCDLALEEGASAAHRGGAPGPQPAAYYAAVRAAMAAEAWSAWEHDFEVESLSWEDLAREAERLGRAFERDTPEAERRGTRSAADVRRTARNLEAHLARRAASGPPASEAERIADLVARLSPVRQVWNPKPSPTPEDDLVSIGMAAVPALVDALSDLSYTRKLDHAFSGRGQFRGAWRVMHVNEVAYSALHRLAAGALRAYGGGEPFPAVGSPEHRDLVARVRAWHEQALARGEAPLLAEIARRGDDSSYAAAVRLTALDPALAVAPTLAGLRVAKHDGILHNLMLVLTKLPGESGWPVVESLLAASEGIGTRLAAAEALLPRKPEAAVPVFIEAWSRPPSATAPANPTEAGGLAPDYEAQRQNETALYPLAVSGLPQAYEALGAGLDARSDWERFAVVIALVAPERLGAFHRVPYGFGVSLAPSRPPAAESAAIIERVLAGRLEDVGRLANLDLTVDGVPLDPVVGEAAAWGLARRFPEKWAFDPRAPAQARNRARLQAANAWRARHGKPPLPVPEPRARPAAVPLSEVAADIREAAVNPDAGARARALIALSARGLPVVPALRTSLGATPPDAPGRADLEAVVRRLAITIAAVEFPVEDAPPPDAALRAFLEAKVGQPLSGDLYVSVLLQVARNMPAGAAGLRLLAAREDPAAGVRLEVELIREPASASGSPSGWDAAGPEVRVGRRLDGGDRSYFSWEYGREQKAWADWGQRIDALLEKAGPDDAIAVRGRLVRQK